MRKRKQRLCCICKKRPVYYNNGLLWKVCKRCYHKQVWVHRPSIMKARKMGLPTPSDDELRAFRLSMIARARCPRGKLKEVMTPAHDKR